MSDLRITPDMSELEDTKLWWRPETVARKLDIAQRTLDRWRAVGKFPAPDYRDGPKLMFWKPETVRNWLAEQYASQDN